MSLYIDVFNGISYEELFPLIKKAGFEGFFSGEIYADCPGLLCEFKKLAEEYDLRQETSHSTIPGCRSVWGEDEEAAASYIALLKRNIDHAKGTDIPILVIHAEIDPAGDPCLERGIERLREVVRYAGEMGIRIAFENINSPEFLYKTLEAFPEEHVGFCYDCGHECCHTFGEEFLPKIGHRLFCTHIHDNDNKRDLHRIPFDGEIDFERVAAQLKNCDCKNITLELTYNDFYAEKYTKEEFIEKSYAAAAKLEAMIRG
ncbi:MAG: sugar phosphate isomerase/epimerase [Clostridiales bacterium]|nr:sugar phosphate isomerase/epimerase [Clostridiales bacterium]